MRHDGFPTGERTEGGEADGPPACNKARPQAQTTPRAVATHKLASGLLLRGREATLEQPVHVLDHRRALGRAVRRDRLLHRSRDLYVSPGLQVVGASGRPAGRAPRRLLELEPARATRLVDPRGDGRVRAPGGPARRSRRRCPLQHPCLEMLDAGRGSCAQRAGRRAERCQSGDEVVPRPRLRQRRGDLRASHPRSRASAQDRLEGSLRRSEGASRWAVGE